MPIIGGYLVPLELPVELDEGHCLASDVMMDSLYPCGVKPNLPIKRLHDPLGVNRDTYEKGVGSP